MENENYPQAALQRRVNGRVRQVIGVDRASAVAASFPPPQRNADRAAAGRNDNMRRRKSAMTLEELSATVTEIKDRLEIRELMSRYGRAVDRLDRELLLSVYHRGAVDDHGCYVGDPDVFAECALSMHAEANTITQHIVTNHVCDLDGDVAHTETYWMYVGMNRTGEPYSMGGGRYVDRLEKRDGRWGIVARKCLMDWTTGGRGTHLTDAENDAIRTMEPSTRDRTDPSYQRPLTIRPDRLPLSDRILAERRARRHASDHASALLDYD